jgi:hypothetical protein
VQVHACEHARRCKKPQAKVPSLVPATRLWTRPIDDLHGPLAPMHVQGVLSQVLPQARQVFERLPHSDAAGAADARFAHFVRSVWPRVQSGERSTGQLIYVPSYFDFVRRAAAWVHVCMWGCGWGKWSFSRL